MEKKLSEITRNDWIRYEWTEITFASSEERIFIRGYEHTPDEAARAKEDWDSTAEERGKTEETDTEQE